MAAKKPDKVEVGIAQLQLNPENFRLAPRPDGAVWTQPALLEYYATREDVQDLARDIALQGTNPSKRLIVEAALSKSNGRHKVLEGNRRVAALRLLREPALAGNAKIERIFKDLRNLAASRLPNGFDVVVLSFEQAKHWIEIEHARGQKGRATVPWKPQEHSRFTMIVRGDARHGRAMALLDLLKERGVIDTATVTKVPITTLDRIIGDKAVRTKLGWVGEIPPIEKSGDALHRIVKDLADGMRVQQVFDRELRSKYIDKVLSDPALSNVARSKAAEKASTRSSPTADKRKTLIPSTFVCKSTYERTKEMVRELKLLHIDGFENVVAIAMRTLLELAITEYIEEHGLEVKETQFGYNMESAIGACCDSMINRQTVDKKLLGRLRQTISDEHHWLSMRSFHSLVHSTNALPDKRELIRKWNEVAAFFDGTIGVSR